MRDGDESADSDGSLSLSLSLSLFLGRTVVGGCGTIRRQSAASFPAALIGRRARASPPLLAVCECVCVCVCVRARGCVCVC